MSTKTCKKCGTVYPIDYPGHACPKCKEPFEIIICKRCGTITSVRVRDRALCKTCFNKTNKIYDKISKQRRYDKMDARFEAWIAKIKKVPANYPTLTEEQWIEACRFFKGCARCNSEQIDTRGFFIGAALGGRYCDWNIIPLCEKCATAWNLNASVFKYTEQKDHISRSREYRDNLEKIVEYLEVKLNNAISDA